MPAAAATATAASPRRRLSRGPEVVRSTDAAPGYRFRSRRSQQTVLPDPDERGYDRRISDYLPSITGTDRESRGRIGRCFGLQVSHNFIDGSLHGLFRALDD